MTNCRFERFSWNQHHRIAGCLALGRRWTTAENRTNGRLSCGVVSCTRNNTGWRARLAGCFVSCSVGRVRCGRYGERYDHTVRSVWCCRLMLCIVVVGVLHTLYRVLFFVLALLHTVMERMLVLSTIQRHVFPVQRVSILSTTMTTMMMRRSVGDRSCWLMWRGIPIHSHPFRQLQLVVGFNVSPPFLECWAEKMNYYNCCVMG